MSYYYGNNFTSPSSSSSGSSENLSGYAGSFSSSSKGSSAAGYSTSRPNSVSPHMNSAYPLYGLPLNSKARFNASRGFDVEDDLEFCPAIVQYHHSNKSATTSNQQPNFSQIHHEVAAVIGSSPSTPTSSSGLSSPPSTGSPLRPSTRVRKAIDIVNPNTGLRVA